MVLRGGEEQFPAISSGSEGTNLVEHGPLCPLIRAQGHWAVEADAWEMLGSENAQLESMVRTLLWAFMETDPRAQRVQETKLWDRVPY